MDGFLTSIVITFKGALEPLAPALAAQLGATWGVFGKLAFLLLVMSLIAGATPAVVRALLLGTLAISFSHVLVTHGYQWSESLFRGTSAVAQVMGLPSADPSSLVTNGLVVAAPIFKTLEEQSTLWVISSPLQHINFLAAAWGVSGAYLVLALLQTGYWILSFALVALAPLMCLFACLPLVNELTKRWFSMVLGTMAGMLAVQVLALGMAKMGQTFATQMQTTFAPGTTHTMSEYFAVGAVGWVLAAVFAWIPLRFSREAGGAASDIIGGVQTMALGALSAAGRVGSSTGQQSIGGSMGGGGASSARETMGSSSGVGGSSSGGGNRGGGTSMGPAQAPGNQWGGNNGQTRP